MSGVNREWHWLGTSKLKKEKTPKINIGRRIFFNNSLLVCSRLKSQNLLSKERSLFYRPLQTDGDKCKKLN